MELAFAESSVCANKTALPSPSVAGSDATGFGQRVANYTSMPLSCHVYAGLFEHLLHICRQLDEHLDADEVKLQFSSTPRQDSGLEPCFQLASVFDTYDTALKCSEAVKALCVKITEEVAKHKFKDEASFQKMYSYAWTQALHIFSQYTKAEGCQEDVKTHSSSPMVHHSLAPLNLDHREKGCHVDSMIVFPFDPSPIEGQCLRLSELKLDDKEFDKGLSFHKQLEAEIVRTVRISKESHVGEHIEIGRPFLVEGATPGSATLCLAIPCTAQGFLFTNVIYGGGPNGPLGQSWGPTPENQEVRFALCQLRKGDVFDPVAMLAQLMLMYKMIQDIKSKRVVHVQSVPLPLERFFESPDLMFVDNSPPNLLMFEVSGQVKTCFKIFDYRGQDSIELRGIVDDRRLVPDTSLVQALTSVSDTYSGWRVHTFSPRYQILEYRYIDGDHHPKSWEQFIEIVEIVAAAHAAGFIHGDLLPQNLIFPVTGTGSMVIDWDLARLVDGAEVEVATHYPTGFNGKTSSYQLFKLLRHPDAVEKSRVFKEHDEYSLVAMAGAWFSSQEVQSQWEFQSHLWDRFQAIKANGLVERFQLLKSAADLSVDGLSLALSRLDVASTSTQTRSHNLQKGFVLTGSPKDRDKLKLQAKTSTSRQSSRVKSGSRS